MRMLICVRGAPGSGKSELIRSMGWTPYALSLDDLRLRRRGPELGTSGLMGISQEDNNSVVKEFLALMDSRMERGEFLVSDQMHDDRPDPLLELARRHRYRVLLMDMAAVPQEVASAQNRQRPDWKQVSDAVLRRFYDKVLHQAPWPGVETIAWTPDGAHRAALQTATRVAVETIDPTQYDRVVHIGDLQGCCTVLSVPGAPFEHGFDPRTLYVFVGDYVDRGIENAQVLAWLLREALSRPNVVLLFGNHEEHLHRWANGLPPVSDEFDLVTRPQLEAAGISRTEVARLLAATRVVFPYQFHDHRVLVTHAGLSTVPGRFEFISDRQYTKGTGAWTDPVDQQFERTAPAGWVQVHGHRNHGYQPVQATPHSFNLEDQVEFGGRLRWATLDAAGWTTGSVRNPIFQLEGARKLEKRKIRWTAPGTEVSAASLIALRSHPGVKERPMAGGSIASFNFTKDTFFNASWDDVVVKARGFFVDTATNTVVARGYNKFFNVGERPETALDRVCQDFAFPVTAYIKENGFLGNIGYDPVADALFIASKSSSAGPFAAWLRALVDQALTPEKQDGLARWLRDNDACLTVEAIDPVNDPHIVEYAAPGLVVLDVFHRHETMERMPYEEAKAAMARFGLTCKRRGPVFATPEALAGWYAKQATNLSARFHGQEIEGVVLEDAAGAMTKVKYASYAFWKTMRGQKDRLGRAWEEVRSKGARRNAQIAANPRHTGTLFDEAAARAEFAGEWAAKGKAIHPLAELFLSWCARQPQESWSQSIIDLRKGFLAAVEVPPEVWAVPYSVAPSADEDEDAGPEAAPVSAPRPRSMR